MSVNPAATPQVDNISLEARRENAADDCTRLSALAKSHGQSIVVSCIGTTFAVASAYAAYGLMILGIIGACSLALAPIVLAAGVGVGGLIGFSALALKPPGMDIKDINKRLYEAASVRRRCVYAIDNVKDGATVLDLCEKHAENFEKLLRQLNALYGEIDRMDEFVANRDKLKLLRSRRIELQNSTDATGSSQMNEIDDQITKIGLKIATFHKHNLNNRGAARATSYEIKKFDGTSDGREFVFWLTGAREAMGNSPSMAAIFSLIGLDPRQFDHPVSHLHLGARPKNDAPNDAEYRKIPQT
jgi:hypothetical protein